MIVNLIGIKKLDFTSDKGEHVVGTKLFVGFTKEGVEGLETDSFFLREGFNLPKDLKPNDKLNLIFDNRKKLESVAKVNS